MPDVKLDYNLNPRQKQRQARLKTVADNMRSASIKVWPATDDMRRLLRHPNGVGFRSEGASEWPHDSFTTRRIRDGSVAVGGSAPQQKTEKTEGLNAREIAYARRPKELPPMQPISVSQPAAEKKNDKPAASPPKPAA